MSKFNNIQDELNRHLHVRNKNSQSDSPPSRPVPRPRTRRSRNTEQQTDENMNVKGGLLDNNIGYISTIATDQLSSELTLPINEHSCTSGRNINAKDVHLTDSRLVI